MRTTRNSSLVACRRPEARPAPRSGWRVEARALAGRAAVAALTGFHAWLLWSHAASGRLLDPATALRWVAAALILSGFVALRRLGRPALWSRKAVILWLLVALLHCHAFGMAQSGPEAGPVPESVIVLVSQIATAGPGVLLGLGLLSLLARRYVARSRTLRLAEVRRFACGTPLAGHVFRLSPRPPPALLLA